ncbi:MAG: hypothetical protein K8S87_09740 [Planctomycetes bacterium]|nr:hypothetical protein [Planctomycetota bacterium]
MKAIADYTRAIEFDSEDADSYDSRGYIFSGQKEYGKAIKDYRKAIECFNDTELIEITLEKIDLTQQIKEKVNELKDMENY